MIPRRITLVILLSAAVLTGGFLLAKWRDSRTFFEPRHLLSRFPVEDAALVSVDFAALRKAGFLGTPKTALEPEYKSFLEATGFDYRRDLDSAFATFGPSGNYFIARGRFQWDKLRAYAKSQGGGCYEQLCRMPGSTPERRISFLPLRDDAIAIGVSTDDLAATKLTQAGKPIETSIPSAPGWMLIPGSALRRPNSLPPGLRLMLSSLTRADRVVLKVGPSGSSVELRLEAQCESSRDAGVLLSQLKTTTATFVEAAKHETDNQPNSLLEFLTAGTFSADDKQVTGRWPVQPRVLASLTQGI